MCYRRDSLTIELSRPSADAGGGRYASSFLAKSNRSRFITLFQAATKSRIDFLRVGASVDFRQGTKLGVRPEIRSTRVAVHLSSPVFRSRPQRVPPSPKPAPTPYMSSKFTKKSLVSVSGRVVKTPCGSHPRWCSTRACRRSAPSSRAPSRLAIAPCRSAVPLPGPRSGLLVIAETIRNRLQHGEGGDIRLLLGGIHASRREGHRHRAASFFAACSTPAQPASTIRSASETFLRPSVPR